MKNTHKIMHGIVGFLVGNLILAILVLAFAFINPFAEDKGDPMTVDQALALVKAGSVTKVSTSADTAIFETNDGRKLTSQIDSPAVRSRIIDETAAYNGQNASSKIVLTEGPMNKGFVALALINIVPGVLVVAISGTIIGFLLFLAFRKKTE